MKIISRADIIHEGAIHSTIILLVVVPNGYALRDELTRLFIPCFTINDMTVYR